MHSWSTPGDIRSRLQRKWNAGRILAAMVGGEPVFPMRIPLKYPTASEQGDQFDAVRQWIATLSAKCKTETGTGFCLQWRETSHRQLGKNRIPVAAIIESEQDALSVIGKQRQAAQFKALAATVTAAFPELKDWLRRRPLQALQYASDWQRLLDILEWISRHPRPDIYLRQIDLPDIHTKFIEHHKRLLIELLDIVLPGEHINFKATGVKGFEQRYGFRSKPAQIRFRLLDPDMSLQELKDLTVPAADLACLKLPVSTVFVTENDINGLAFPRLANSMVIFGLGYGLQALRQISWLHDKAIYYWGDIDTHGFAMLDQIRQYFPHTEALLMDEETLLAHRTLWGKENKPARRDLKHLKPPEMELYQKIVQDCYQENLRLEQERIGFGSLETALSYLRT